MEKEKVTGRATTLEFLSLGDLLFLRRQSGNPARPRSPGVKAVVWMVAGEVVQEARRALQLILSLASGEADVRGRLDSFLCLRKWNHHQGKEGGDPDETGDQSWSAFLR